jgi:hypothetical protein
MSDVNSRMSKFSVLADAETKLEILKKVISGMFV